MPRGRNRPPTLEDKIINVKDLNPDDGMIHKKRDRAGAKIPTRIKQLKVDAALGIDSSFESTVYSHLEDDFLSEKNGIVAEAKEKNDNIDLNGNRREKTSKIPGDSKILDGLMLRDNQRKFVISFCNPDSPMYNDKFGSFKAAGYAFKNKNTLVANVSKLLGNAKIKLAMDRYRQEIISSKKLEISTETVDMLRKRANYEISMFYNTDGTMIPYSEVPLEWHCCIDDLVLDYKGARADKQILKYKLCDRQKALDTLNKIMEITQTINGQSGVSAAKQKEMSITAAIDSGKDDTGKQGPRIVFNITQFDKE